MPFLPQVKLVDKKMMGVLRQVKLSKNDGDLKTSQISREKNGGGPRGGQIGREKVMSLLSEIKLAHQKKLCVLR